MLGKADPINGAKLTRTRSPSQIFIEGSSRIATNYRRRPWTVHAQSGFRAGPQSPRNTRTWLRTTDYGPATISRPGARTASECPDPAVPTSPASLAILGGCEQSLLSHSVIWRLLDGASLVGFCLGQKGIRPIWPDGVQRHRTCRSLQDTHAPPIATTSAGPSSKTRHDAPRGRRHHGTKPTCRAQEAPE